MEYSILVNRDHPLLEEVPFSFVETKDIDNNVVLIEEMTYHNFCLLQKKLQENNIFVMIDSGYRSFEMQQVLLEHFYKQLGEDAKRRVAPVGTSEHHTGLAIDLSLLLTPVEREDEQDRLKREDSTYRSIVPFLAEFGFILRYPPLKEDITGYIYEPWHIRYVGKELACYLQENDYTLEEYYKIKRKVKRP